MRMVSEPGSIYLGMIIARLMKVYVATARESCREETKR
ncbi:MAG: hypothetical protein OJF51_004367 [Nitrospira sp.]|nr:MAG: hypothetical protein OJF51_004367 [Nitrospira sp.]